MIEDDGRGFDVSAPAEGMGLAGMRERVSLLDGTSSIESRRGRGTTIVVELPVRGGGMSAIRVLIVDDHAVVRSGLRLAARARGGHRGRGGGGDRRRGRSAPRGSRSRTSCCSTS